MMTSTLPTTADNITVPSSVPTITVRTADIDNSDVIVGVDDFDAHVTSLSELAIVSLQPGENVT